MEKQTIEVTTISFMDVMWYHISHIAKSLSYDCNTCEQAFAVLDEALMAASGREVAKNGVIYRNTTDETVLKQLITSAVVDKISGIGNNPYIETVKTYLELWKAQPSQATKRTIVRVIPDELQTPEAKKVIQRAIQCGIIEDTPEGLNWHDTKQLLSYFAYKATNVFLLSMYNGKDGSSTTNWRLFEKTFGVKGLSGAYQNWMRLNTKFEPTGYESIDVLFE